MNPRIEKHYSIKKAAELFGVSIETIRRRINDGSLPAVMFAGNCVRIPESALAKFLAERAIKSPEVSHGK